MRSLSTLYTQCRRIKKHKQRGRGHVQVEEKDAVRRRLSSYHAINFFGTIRTSLVALLSGQLYFCLDYFSLLFSPAKKLFEDLSHRFLSFLFLWWNTEKKNKNGSKTKKELTLLQPLFSLDSYDWWWHWRRSWAKTSEKMIPLPNVQLSASDSVVMRIGSRITTCCDSLSIYTVDVLVSAMKQRQQ